MTDADAGADPDSGSSPDEPADHEADDEPSWRPIFGHDEPYGEQVDGIETTIETGREGGYVALEGACGTGKTMLALTAGIRLVRDPSTDFERVFVLTSVKQQLRQFEADLRTINRNLPEDHRSVTGLTLVGKADVCPYNREGAGGIDDDNVYDRCENLRERTRDLADETIPDSLAAHARSQQVGLADSGREDGGARYLETAGEPTPYPPEMPEHDGDGASVEYCPFYAQYLADVPEDGDSEARSASGASRWSRRAEAVPFDFSSMGFVEPEDLVALSVGHGTCPHSMMGAVLPHVEVVVGNYYHAFDPTTVESFTGALLDDSTFVICDEAHMLEPRVRDLVSDGVADATLRDAERELGNVIEPLAFAEREARRASEGEPRSRERTGEVSDEAAQVREALEDTDVTLSELRDTRAFVRGLREELDRRVTAHLDREHGRGWRGSLPDLEDDEIPLRDPEEPAPDEISEWAAEEGYDGGIWARAEAVGAVVARILDELEEEDRQRAAPGVGRVLGEWYRADHEQFFREIELERTWDDTHPVDSWRRAYTARLALHNCVPSAAIGKRLAEFGGGVLMSATLAPLDVFREVTGLDHLHEQEGRPVVERTYGLNFPEENRESFAVAAPKFTYENRGPVPQRGTERTSGERERGTSDASTSDDERRSRESGDPEAGEATETRRLHARAIAQVAAGPGNVLVGMPSYAEAEWAAGVLEGAPSVEKPVLLDEATTDAVTEDLKERFFAGEPKVLVTSLRGTLTEGVDYRGDRLRAAVVCGVPIVNTASPRTRAVRTAYDREFGDGFRYALAVPAVRKARQAVGRVIRGPDESGVRVLLDERYARDSWDSVRDLLGPEREEFQPVSPDMLSLGLERFRDGRTE